MCGDGGFSMLMGISLAGADEAAGENRYLNNSVLGFVAMEMKAGAI
jgi:hypothetical protein